MTNSQLIPVVQGIIGDISCLTIDGRTLHQALQVRRKFATWIQSRIEKYGFVEGQDFVVDFPVLGNQKNGKGGDRRSQEYTLTIDMGKELSMVENNEAGRVARRYFIECERALLTGTHGQPVHIPTTPSTVEDRRPLCKLIQTWSRMSGVHQSFLWTQVSSYFNLEGIANLPVEWLPDALDFVQSKIDALPKALPPATVPNSEINALLAKVDFYLREITETEKRISDIATADYRTRHARSRQEGTEYNVRLNTACTTRSLWTAIDFSLKAIRGSITLQLEQ